MRACRASCTSWAVASGRMPSRERGRPSTSPSGAKRSRRTRARNSKRRRNDMEEASVPSKAILLVEDNPDDEDLVMRSLRKASIANDVVVKQDGYEALEYLYGPEGVCKSGQVPALVLLDLKMPRIGGIEVLRRIRQ